jgi:poly-gamma-glutamate capsule biosynthesis protein CapA/YwtB (metallophosphatase superfamily)
MRRRAELLKLWSASAGHRRAKKGCQPILLAGLLVLILSACRPERSVTLALLGDINLGRGVNPSAGTFSLLAKDLAGADLAMANLESPLSADPPANSSGYNLCAPQERAGLLSKWGLDLLSLANNHRLDCGSRGDTETGSILETSGIAPIGSGMEPVLRTVNGLRLAFLAFDDVTSGLEVEKALQAIRSAHDSHALVIVSVHWGMEYQSGASERQEWLARQFSRAGASLIWGHHPHVLQPADWIDTDQGRTLVLYSLGNALFDQPGLADTRESALALVRLGPEGVQSLQAVPFMIDLAESILVKPDEKTARKILDTLKIK